MSTSSPHGFDAVRRGYRPEQVEAYLAALRDDLATADDRVSRLTLLARELSDEAARLHTVVATLPEQTYETLGARAVELLATAQAEADDLRTTADTDADTLLAAARNDARTRRDQAHDAAARIRATADADAARTLDAARNAADAETGAARTDAAATRAKAERLLGETAHRCAALLADQETEHTARTEETDRELADAERAADDRAAETDDRAETLLAKARQALADAETAARRRQQEADARAAELLAEARATQQRIEDETADILAHHEERADAVRRHMTHVRAALATLGSRPAPELPHQADGDD